MPKFVQFHHNGGEHEPREEDLIHWNTGDDLRKFIETQGSWLDGDGTRKDGTTWLWGEWEPESKVVHRFDHNAPGFPRYLWQPYWRPKRDYGQCANTDPIVFGGFYYSDCHQKNNRGLRDLLNGSVIVFGSLVNGEWGVDTVFVVSQGARIEFTITTCYRHCSTIPMSSFQQDIGRLFSNARVGC